VVEEGDVQVARHGRQGQRPRVSPFAADVGYGDADLARVSKGYDAVGVHAMVVDAVGNPEGVHRAPVPLQRVVAEGDAEAVEQVIVDEAEKSILVLTIGRGFCKRTEYTVVELHQGVF